MGSGKSSVAQLLQDKIKWPALDTDVLIEKKFNKKISEIFSEFGEETFRDYETEVLKEVTSQDNIILSTGGGIVEKNRNHLLLKQNSKVIYLKTTAESVLKFTSSDKNRPLLNVDNPLKVIQERLSRREPIYKSLCDYEVSSCEGPLVEAAEKIFRLIGL